MESWRFIVMIKRKDIVHNLSS